MLLRSIVTPIASRHASSFLLCAIFDIDASVLSVPVFPGPVLLFATGIYIFGLLFFDRILLVIDK